MFDKYNLTDEELETIKIVEIWLDTSEKYFPNYNHTKLKKGDPRKSILFKICYKLLRETKGLIKKEDYPLYIRSQLEVLKFQSKNNPLVLVDPICLVGEKAWIRWRLWKKKYDDKLKTPVEISNGLKFLKAKESIVRTKKFISNKLGNEPSMKDYENNKSNLLNWINFGNISPYYITLSPYMMKIFSKDDISKLNFDLSFYQDCINDEVIELFNKLFYYEVSK